MCRAPPGTSTTEPVDENCVPNRARLSPSGYRCGAEQLKPLQLLPGVQGFPHGCQSDDRERQLIKVIVEVEDLREARASRQLFIPASIGKLRPEQILDAMIQAGAARVPACDETHDGPCRLGGCAFRRRVDAIVVTCAAFTPAAIGILNRA